MSERALVLTTVVGFSVIDFSGDGNETQLNQSHLAKNQGLEKPCLLDFEQSQLKVRLGRDLSYCPVKSLFTIHLTLEENIKR